MFHALTLEPSGQFRRGDDRRACVPRDRHRVFTVIRVTVRDEHQIDGADTFARDAGHDGLFVRNGSNSRRTPLGEVTSKVACPSHVTFRPFNAARETTGSGSAAGNRIKRELSSLTSVGFAARITWRACHFGQAATGLAL